MSEFCEYIVHLQITQYVLLAKLRPLKFPKLHAFFGKEHAQVVLVGMLNKIEARNTPSLSVLIHVYFIYCNNYT